MKIKIDREGCIQCGACVSSCSEVFELPDDEKAMIVVKFRKADPSEGEVGEDLGACAQGAADSCPVSVISVE
jgi:ferredoxin